MYIGFVIFFFILIFVNLVGNILVIFVVSLNKVMRFLINYLLINLVIVDMIVVLFIGILFVVIFIFIYFEGKLGDIFCKLFIGGNVGWVGVLVFVFILVVVVIEWYGVVLYFYSQKGKLIRIRLIVFIVICWMFFVLWVILGFNVIMYMLKIKSCVYSWLKLIYVQFYMVGWFVVVGVIFIGILGVFYLRMVYYLWFRKDNIREVIQKVLKCYWKCVIKMVVVVIVIYVLCWVFELLIYFLGFMGIIIFVGVYYVIVLVLIVFNFSVNLIVYSLQSSQFRKYLIDLIFCKCNRVVFVSFIVMVSIGK